MEPNAESKPDTPKTPPKFPAAKTFKDLKQLKREKRARKRASSLQLIKSHNIPYTEHNGGAHLVVGDWHFWPGTGLYLNAKTQERARGVREFIKRWKSEN